MKTPNFLIVGAAKSGTTSMCNYLRQHSNIFIPEFKEPQFFVYEKTKDRLHKQIKSFDEYQKLFNNRREQIIGEGSVFYLFFYQEAIKNIKKYCDKDVKVLIILRNPIDRCLSAYHHVRRNNLMETLSLKEALNEEQERYKKNKNITPMTLYKSMGLYYHQVKAYLDNFKNVKIVIYDDFKKDPSKVYGEILSFLELDKEKKINFNIKENVGGWQWKNKFLRFIFLNKNIIKVFLRFLLTKNLLNKLKQKYVSMSTNRVTANREIKSYLCNYYKEDIKKLSDLLNIDLSFWIK